MSVFSARPDLTPTASVALMEAESTMPSPLQRYHQASKKADCNSTFICFILFIEKKTIL